MAGHFCTYFDEGYLARGMAMLESVRRHHPGARFTAFCLTENCRKIVAAHAPGDLTVLGVADLEERFPELLVAKPTRNRIEYFFTITPFVIRHVLEDLPEESWAIYLDADLWFYSSPEPIFQEIEDASVAIIPHRFSPGREWMEVYGKFNVGWISFRRNEAGKKVLDWWAERCLDWCHDRVEEGRFGDQKYLDDFPERFSGVHIVKHPGANLAPWNLQTHQITKQAEQVLVDGQPLIFFHFHGVAFPHPGVACLPFLEWGIPFTRVLKHSITQPWLKALEMWDALVQDQPTGLRRAGQKELNDPLDLPLRELITLTFRGQYLFRPSPALARTLGQKLVGKLKRQHPGKPELEMVRFEGLYPNWAAARADSMGYNASNILEVTRASMRKVVSGEAAYERDSVLMSVPEYPFSTLAACLPAAASHSGKLHVLDVGGALGSTYYACRPWLDEIPDLQWRVVEQPHYVACGREEFSTPRLSFHDNIEEAWDISPPDLVMFSGSLQFFPEPLEILNLLCRRRARYLVLERTPFCERNSHVITVEKVPPWIYEASYPCWLFNEKLLLDRLAPVYDLMASYPALDGLPWDNGPTCFKGLFFRCKGSAA